MMNQEDLFKKLGAILNELNDQYEYLAQNPQKFNELELELFLANANFLADHIQIIRKLNSNKVMKELPEHIEEPEVKISEEPLPKPVEQLAEPVATEVVEHPQIVDEQPEQTAKVDEEAVSFEFVLHERPQAEVAELPHIEEPEIVSQQPETELHKGDAAGEEQVEQADEIGSEPFLMEKEEDKIPAPTHELVVDDTDDKLAKPTLNEMLAGNLRRDKLEPAAASAPQIKDLKQAINLNDKLLYIKDLFNGYNLAYSEAIELINKMPDFKTADTFLKNNYAEKNNWAAKQATVNKFYELLRRRF